MRKNNNYFALCKNVENLVENFNMSQNLVENSAVLVDWHNPNNWNLLFTLSAKM